MIFSCMSTCTVYTCTLYMHMRTVELVCYGYLRMGQNFNYYGEFTYTV